MKKLVLFSLCTVASVSWCMNNPNKNTPSASAEEQESQPGSSSTNNAPSSLTSLSSSSFGSSSAVNTPSVSVTLAQGTNSCNCMASAPLASGDGRFRLVEHVEGIPNRIMPIATPSGIRYFAVTQGSSSVQQLAAAPSTPKHEQLLRQIGEQNELIQKLLQERSSAESKRTDALERAIASAEKRADVIEDELQRERCARCLEELCRSNHHDDCSTYRRRKTQEEADEDAKKCLAVCCIASSLWLLHEAGCCDWMCNKCAGCCKKGTDETKDQNNDKSKKA